MDKETQEKIVQDISSEISFQLGLLMSELRELFGNYPNNFNRIMLELSRIMVDKGYRKLPKDKPPLLSFKEDWCKDPPTLAEPDKPLNCPENCEICKLEIQREADIKHYEGKRNEL